MNESRNTPTHKPIYTAVFNQDEVVFGTLTDYSAETMGG
jgi:hypothetical protein